MEVLSIPSPSVFLRSPLLDPTRTSKPTMKASPNGKTSIGDTAAAGVSTKPKQSKSRNGCVTCKAKRLKCDETKPSCQQCHKRGVQCGGYKKDFKWRPFEEATFTNKTSTKSKKAPSSISVAFSSKNGGSAPSSPAMSDASVSTLGPDVAQYTTTFSSQGTPPQVSPIPQHPSQIPSLQHQFFADISTTTEELFALDPSPYMLQPDQSRNAPRSHPGSYASSVQAISPIFEESVPSPASFSGQSPKLIDLLLPGTDLNARPAEYMNDHFIKTEPGYNASMQRQMQPTPPAFMDDDADFDEEIIRDPLEQSEVWMRLPSPSPSASSSSSGSSSLSRTGSFNPLYLQPVIAQNSPEMLTLRFDKQTCGILSIKDGPNENPWRTLIWPLAKESPALYHAISSMTAFHVSRQCSSLRVDGMEHMRRSIRALAAGINEMRTDAALATTLVLAFSESWDQHISTGIEHLRGARALVNQALVKHKKRALAGPDLARLKFLCNTWIYMDVIARLSSDDDDESNPFDGMLPQAYGPLNDQHEIDPLMGVSATLFPLIGRVANLARKIRMCNATSVTLIQQAMELKTLIENWTPGVDFDQPEDPTSHLQHSFQTAEAYRWATLLYLHQAVPEIPSLTTAQLAKKVLVYIATVPMSSRTVIIHIYPLLVAGVEVTSREERDWVKERWAGLAQRLCIGNVDKCWEITKEVWARRDAYQTAKAKRFVGLGRSNSEGDSPKLYKRKFEPIDEEEIDLYEWSAAASGGAKRRATSGEMGTPKVSIVNNHARKSSTEMLTEEDMDYEFTVRGRLHWAGVMKEWRWEVLLG